MAEPKHGGMKEIRGHLLGLLGLSAAAAFFMYGYLPERAARIRLEREMERARARIQVMDERIRLLDLSCRELEAEEPEAVLDAIRDVLRLDVDPGYVLSTEAGSVAESPHP